MKWNVVPCEGIVDAGVATWLVAAPPTGSEHPWVQLVSSVTERRVVTLTFTGAEAVE